MKRGWTMQFQARDKSGKLAPEHGLSKTVTGRIWAAMMSRCFNKELGHTYELYGGRGITVCEYLRATPANLVALIGERPSRELSIDRIENDDHYSCGACPECVERGWYLNVRWATRKQQGNNRRTNNLVTINGDTRTVTEWAEISGIPRGIIFRRLRLGWAETKLLAPVHVAQSVTINGETRSILEWCAQIGICEEAFRKRLRRGVPDHLLTLPKQKPRAFVNRV